jgi:AraC-like DNA-binding protein
MNKYDLWQTGLERLPDKSFFYHYDIIPFTNMPLHWHPEIEILYFVKGDVKVFANQLITTTARPGDIVFLSPYAMHRLCPVDTTTPVEYHCLNVKVDAVSKSALNLPVEKLPCLITTNNRVREYMDRIIEELNGDLPYRDEFVTCEFASLITMLFRIVNTSEEYSLRSFGTQTKAVREAIQYIHAHGFEKITVEDICRHVGFSKSHFSSVFRKITGQTMMDFIIYFRLSYAREQILSGHKSIRECALESGFNDVSYFIKRYRRQFGESPSMTRSKTYYKAI